MKHTMSKGMKQIAGALVFVLALTVSAYAQAAGAKAARRAPTKPTRPFVVRTAQSLADLERRFRPRNKGGEPMGGGGGAVGLGGAALEKNGGAAAAGPRALAAEYYMPA